MRERYSYFVLYFYVQRLCQLSVCSFFFFNDTATTEIYTLSLHDALPISSSTIFPRRTPCTSPNPSEARARPTAWPCGPRSEEHTSELQSQSNLVCRLLLEKKKKNNINNTYESIRSE